jgi:tRNA nucleotidyltransferase (CCA-adding enzyme)
MVVEGDAIALAHGLEKRFGGHITTHSRFGTAKWNIAAIHTSLASLLEKEAPNSTLIPDDLPASLDLISARTEFYDYPTALPTVERSSIKLDLHRRDFSINTLALRLDGHHYGDLYDYWGGRRDLQKKLLRVLHSLSFVDDPTRQLRAVRFEQRFDFKIEARTLQLMREGNPLLRHLSGDRVRHELNLILEEEHAIAMLRRLSELGLLAAIHPDLPEMKEPLEALLALALFTHPAAEWNLPLKNAGLPLNLLCAYLVWLLELSLEKALSVANHLRLSAAAQEMLASALRLKSDLPGLEGLPISQVVKRLDEVPISAIYALHLTSDVTCLDDLLVKYARTWRHIWPVTNGEILNQRGLSPGPAYKSILNALRAAWLDGRINSPLEETTLLEELLIS